MLYLREYPITYPRTYPNSYPRPNPNPANCSSGFGALPYVVSFAVPQTHKPKSVNTHNSKDHLRWLRHRLSIDSSRSINWPCIIVCSCREPLQHGWRTELLTHPQNLEVWLEQEQPKTLPHPCFAALKMVLQDFFGVVLWFSCSVVINVVPFLALHYVERCSSFTLVHLKPLWEVIWPKEPAQLGVLPALPHPPPALEGLVVNQMMSWMGCVSVRDDTRMRQDCAVQSYSRTRVGNQCLKEENYVQVIVGSSAVVVIWRRAGTSWAVIVQICLWNTTIVLFVKHTSLNTPISWISKLMAELSY